MRIERLIFRLKLSRLISFHLSISSSLVFSPPSDGPIQTVIPVLTKISTSTSFPAAAIKIKIPKLVNAC